ncbi:MAG: T9SS type A sorting domain-containing protein, partial [Flavobacteriaceae bacterium]
DDWGTINFLNNGAVYTYLGTSVQTFTATLPSVTVPDGSTFSLRIFPYALQNGIASVPTMATHRNVMICGTTTPVSTTPEEQCLINYLTEGPCGGYTPDTMINDGCSVSMGSDPVLYVSGYDTTFGQTVTVDGWQAGTYDPTRYIAFNVKPLPNNTLTVTSVSFDYADLGATDNAVHGYIVFDVGSGSNWTTNFLGNIDYSTQSVQTFTYQIPVASQSAVIPDGQYFILKIYLWANVDEGAVPFFPTHKDVTICGITEPSLSIEQQILPKISMYPNPVTDDLYFQSDNIIEKVEIIDRTGKIVLKTAFYNTQGEIRMTGLSSGLYFARVISGKNTEVMKIVKR